MARFPYFVLALGLAAARVALAQVDDAASAWGYDLAGQCAVPAPNEGFVAVAGGEAHSFGLRADGTIVAWGDGALGQLDVPDGGGGYLAVAAGRAHGLALRADGSVAAWGDDGNGQCDVPAPNADFAAVAAGNRHSLGLKADGTIVTWGANFAGQGNVPAPNAGFTAIAAGGDLSLALRADGSVAAWGRNDHGQCVVPEPNAGFVAIAASFRHSLALRADGSLVAWGANDDGEGVVPAPNAGFTAIAAGGSPYHGFSLALRADGSLAAWGHDGQGQCRLPGPNAGFAAVGAGWRHALAIGTPHPHETREWHVAPDGDDGADGSPAAPFRTLQRAVDAAVTGEVVVLADGTYGGAGNANVQLGEKAVVVRARSGDAERCVIEAGGANGLVFAAAEPGVAAGPTLRDLTIRGANAALRADGLDFWAYPETFARVTVEGCRLVDGTHGVVARWAALAMRDTRVARNAGRGLELRGFGSSADVADCEFRDGGTGLWYQTIGAAAKDGAPQAPREAPAFTVVRSVFAGNDLGFNGAGLEYPDATFRACRFDSNAVGLVAVSEIAPLALVACDARDNLEDGLRLRGHRVSIAGPSRITGNGGTGIALTAMVTDLTVDDAEIAANGAWGIGAAACEDDYAGRTTLRRCRVSGNQAGGVRGFNAEHTVEDCVVTGNGGPGLSLARCGAAPASLTVAGSTLAANLGPGLMTDHDVVDLARVLIAHNDGVAADLPAGAAITMGCCDLFGNAGGDWVGPVAPWLGQAGNIAADPIFCAPADGDFTLRDDSPCADGQHPHGAPCGGIGALGVGCTAEQPVVTITPLPSANVAIGCGGSDHRAFHFAPGATAPAVAGYVVRVTAGDAVAFTAADVTVFTVPATVPAAFDVWENGPNDCTVSYTVLGPGADGIAVEADLFAIDFHGAHEGVAAVTIVEATFLDFQGRALPAQYGAPAAVAVDCTAPPPVTGVAASPGAGAVSLAWTVPEDPDVAALVLLRAAWDDGGGGSAYPLYGRLVGGAPPARPASLAAALASGNWRDVATLGAETSACTDSVAVRGIYFYELFALDAAGNASEPPAHGAAATSYLLGDVAPGGGDGRVDDQDVVQLAATYGATADQPGFAAMLDVGPTAGGLGTSLPLPDGVVAFEDLMVVAQNHALDAAPSPPAPGAPPQLVWQRRGETSWACVLAQPCERLKGLRVTAPVPAGVAVTVTAGDLLAEQPAPVFLQNDGPGLDVGLSVLGAGRGLVGHGELLRVQLDAPADVARATIDARGLDNESLVSAVATAVDETPSGRFAVAPNAPNPFNASTTIGFDLPRPQRAEVAVYSLDGRRVKRLLNDALAAGRHVATWDGTDERGGAVASGTYVCRIDAGPYRAARKMILAK